MRTLATAALLSLAACAPPTSAPVRTPDAQSPLGSIDLAMRAAGARAYEVIVRERAAMERRGSGPGRAHHDLALRFTLRRSDTPGAGGVASTFTFTGVDARAYEPLSRAAAGAARALEGASVTTESDTRGKIVSFNFSGQGRAKALAERLAAAFTKLSPGRAPQAKGPGERWGETTSIPVLEPNKSGAVIEPSTPRYNVQAGYVFQRTGLVNGRPCAVLGVDLRPGANFLSPGAPVAALTSSGTGQGEVCVDPASGHARQGWLDLTLRNEVGMRAVPDTRVQPLHLEETRRLRIDVRETEGA